MRRAWHLCIAASLVGLLSFVNPVPLSAADDDTKEAEPRPKRWQSCERDYGYPR